MDTVARSTLSPTWPVLASKSICVSCVAASPSQHLCNLNLTWGYHNRDSTNQRVHTRTAAQVRLGHESPIYG